MNVLEFVSVLEAGGFKPVKVGNGWKSRCPGHDGDGQSLSITEGDDGRTLLTCFAHHCAHDRITSRMGLKTPDLFDKRLPSHSLKESGPRAQRSSILGPVVATYSYRDEGGVELYQVRRHNPKEFRPWRPDPAKVCAWVPNLDGVDRVPYRLQGLRAAIQDGDTVFFTEGERDADSLASHGVASTTLAGGGGWGKHAGSVARYFEGAHLVIIADKDKAGRKYSIEVAAALSPVVKSVRVVEVPDVGGKQCKDVTDFISAGGTVEELSAIADSTPDWSPKSVTTVTPQGTLSEYIPQAGEEAPEQPIKLTVRRPFEILALPDDPDDNLLGDRLLSKGNPLVILGPGGCHKSRLLLQLAAAMTSGRDFHGLPTHAQGKRWLILQAENDNRRLKYDLEAIKAWLTPEEWEQFNDLVHIHTLESEWDCMVALDDPAAVARMAALIEETAPDIVGVDSFYNVGIGDLNRDVDMRNSCMALAQLVKRGNPKRATVVLHHALTGKAGALKSTGWDRSSYGRNSKLLHSWTRGQINVAPGSDDGTSVVLSCGKASNGKEFEPRAAKLDSSGILLPDPNFDFSAWEFEVSDGTRRKSAAVCVNDVAALARDLAKGDLVKALIDEHGIAKTRAYELVAEAEKKRLIVRSPLSKRYNPK